MAPVNNLPERVCLITPPSVFLLDERVFPSLGILKIGAVLEQRGVAVDMIDLSGVENYLEPLREYLEKASVVHIGITTTTPQLPATTRVIEVIRATRPDISIILGGPHVTLVAAAARLERKANRVSRGHRALQSLHELCDVLVAGDGEEAVFVALCPDPPRLVDADDPDTGLFMSDLAYEQSPWPGRHLIDLDSYHYTIEGERSTSLIGQLGCPFGCGFCGGRNTPSLRRIRMRSVGSIVGELEHLHRTYGYTAFMFYDDELNVNKEIVGLLRQIQMLQKSLGVEFRLRGFVKAELFTMEQAKEMYNAGFRWLLTGFESGSPRILTNINKRATRAENSRAIEYARAAGLKVKALMSIGHPGESHETVSETRDWLLETKPDDFDCTIITTYPGTPYYDEAVRHDRLPDVYTYTMEKTGDKLHAYDVDYLHTADFYKGDPDGGYKAYTFTEHLTSEELVALRDWVERSVREKLHIAFNPARAALRYEHSMGMGAGLPPFILRSQENAVQPE